MSEELSVFETYADSPRKQQELYRRILTIIVISQIFGGAGLTAGITVGALLAQDMLRTGSYAGVPAALFTAGSAGAALIVGHLSEHFGRRLGLAMGFFAGGIGAAGVVISAVNHNIPVLFISLFIYGAGTATNLQARYAGTDLANDNQRAMAISIALVSTTFGAVAGPNLGNLTGSFAKSIGIPVLAGPFILAAIAFILAGLVLLVLLRPDPLVVAKAIADLRKTDKINSLKSMPFSIDKKGLMVGALVMVLTQIIMIAIMTMTPVHMKFHGHGLGDIGMILSIHIGAMYLPSLVTGILVDKLGRTIMTIASGITLLIAGILAAVAPVDSILTLTVALALLGLGWNFGLISGTALIVDATNPSARAKTQGAVDVLIALAGASGGALSGMVVAHYSFRILSLAGGILSLVLMPAILWYKSNNKN